MLRSRYYGELVYNQQLDYFSVDHGHIRCGAMGIRETAKELPRRTTAHGCWAVLRLARNASCLVPGSDLSNTELFFSSSFKWNSFRTSIAITCWLPHHETVKTSNLAVADSRSDVRLNNRPHHAYHNEHPPMPSFPIGNPKKTLKYIGSDNYTRDIRRLQKKRHKRSIRS